MMTKWYLALPLILMTTTAAAWLCPNNFNNISVGDTLADIQAKCGTPVSEVKMEGEINVPQEWSYYVQVAPPNPATIKMSIVLIDNKIANITVNATSLVSTDLCGSPVSIGMPMETLRTTCGNPIFVNKQPPKPGQKPTQINELKYNGPAPNVLVFENGLLKERK